jgi:5-formyltetrahydrofolate cyclo-ligase
MLKSEARKIYREKRISLADKERVKLDDLLLIQFQTVPFPFLEYLLSYWPMEENKEINTHLFTDYLEFINPGLKVSYPKTDFEKIELKALLTNDETEFEQNQYNIYEPEDGEIIAASEIDFVIVPMLICDMFGQRAGYGKGFYDRYLKNCREDCIKVGLSYFEPVDKIDDTNQFDVPLNLCITPQNIYVF